MAFRSCCNGSEGCQVYDQVGGRLRFSLARAQRHGVRDPLGCETAPPFAVPRAREYPPASKCAWQANLYARAKHAPRHERWHSLSVPQISHPAIRQLACSAISDWIVPSFYSQFRPLTRRLVQTASRLTEN